MNLLNSQRLSLQGCTPVVLLRTKPHLARKVGCETKQSRICVSQRGTKLKKNSYQEERMCFSLS